MSFVNTDFIVNEEQRIIICIIYTANDYDNRLRKYQLPHSKRPEIKIYKGIAHCAPGDTWDETYGKHLAEYRAQVNRIRDINTRIDNFIEKETNRLALLKKCGKMRMPRRPHLEKGDK